MMLTLKQQPVHYGYRPIHDLPTPPSTSRSSPPVTVQETTQKPLPAIPRKSSPAQGMSQQPHRGLPLPAAMTLPQPAPPQGQNHPPGPPLHSQAQQQQQQQQPPPHPPLSQTLGALPAPPQWQGPGSDESMRNWLIAKTEEERRRQEEEKTRQEGYRLEQRKLEHDMLRTSLDRGIPPPMVPVVFAGMSGGLLPQAALEFAQQYLVPQQGHPPQLMPAQGPLSPEHRRDSQSQQYASYAGSVGVPSTPGSGPGPQGGFVPYQGPGSPTRARAHTMSMAGQVGRSLGSSLPRLSTNEPGVPPHGGHPLGQQQSAQQQETQSPSIYFHHWQPPTSQANASGGSNQPATPSVDSPRKRKATGPQQPAPLPSTQARYRSPPFNPSVGGGGPSTLANPPPGRRRGHSRQRSDLASYRPPGRGRGDSFGPNRGMSPSVHTPREAAPAAASAPSATETSYQRSGGHSVSSLLSEEPSPHYAPEMRSQPQGEAERRQSPTSSEERSRGGVAGSALPRERDNE
ncbi:uncharacterized protein BCR38DRAFT_485172 [Pseudomassariella vexata]|uniref:Uncharacterized protein n=1 Tax=Pseudomassariella vexata TaxID=1141098 RepID=A0A1Y2DXN6_9PEZI|nr:uncharacterized protein BCR38DRAFT_485172 [Pseudomassariella vexata]ORY64031.1 hypothetical protein BCR38DRAFT_485172 [Pseudomassariella vexata]